MNIGGVSACGWVSRFAYDCGDTIDTHDSKSKIQNTNIIDNNNQRGEKIIKLERVASRASTSCCSECGAKIFQNKSNEIKCNRYLPPHTAITVNEAITTVAY